MATPSRTPCTMNPEEIRVAAAKEMGWRCFAGHDWIAPSDQFESRYTQELPQYTTSCDAALELVEKLREEGWRCSLNNGLDGGWECEFIRPVQPESPPEHVGFLAGEDVEVRYSPDDSLPMAICLGFLKVRGHTA